MLPVVEIILHEIRQKTRPVRMPEPSQAMENLDQVKSYVESYEWGGPTSALMIYHLKEISKLIRPGDTVIDLACGPGILILELAALYPDCDFVGADLSAPMLSYLESEAKRRGLRNVMIVKEDVSTLFSLNKTKFDLVISTSALHHMPDEETLLRVFKRVRSLLTVDGSFYFFDFGLLRSQEARKLFVAEVAKLSPPLTALDYDLSLQAAFPIEYVFKLAEEWLPKPFIKKRSLFVDFHYFLQSPPRSKLAKAADEYIQRRWRELSLSMKLEYLMLRFLSRAIRPTVY